MQILFFVGVAAFIGLLIWFAWWLEKKRTEKMEAFAQSRGFAFEGEAHSIGNQLYEFKLFNQGHSATVKNAMRGAKEVGAIHVCDYQYVTGSGKNRHTHHQTIAVVHTPGRNAPHFFVRRQNRFFDAVGKLFGGQDINFDDDPEFSKTWVLQTSGDEGSLRHFMSSRLREHLTRVADRNFVLEVSGEYMLIHQSKRLKKEEDIDALLADAVNIRRLWS